jgi:hypothetical protein
MSWSRAILRLARLLGRRRPSTALFALDGRRKGGPIVNRPAKGLFLLGVAFALLGWAPPAWAVATWTVQPTADVTAANVFDSVAAASSSDAWAVGSYLDTAGVRQTLIEHYDGAAWTVQPSQNLGTGDNELHGVRATSSTNAWAVGGRYYSTTGSTVNLIEHFDGVRWTHQVNPDYRSVPNRLLAVAANSSSNAIAVGDTFSRSSSCGLTGTFDERPVIEHWDGTSWTMMKSPNPSYEADSLHGVTVLSRSNAWAVGCTAQSFSCGNFGMAPLIEHWDGTTWSVQAPAQGAPRCDTEFESVSATSSSDVWAVGWWDFNVNGSPEESNPVIEHYDGTKWTAFGEPVFYGRLYGVKAVSSTNAWAVGYWFETPNGAQHQPLVLHWNGSKWSVQAQFSGLGAYDTSLSGVSSTGSSYAFAAGSESTASDGSTSDTLAVHCC